jgi:hypothetical protein
MPRRHGSRRVGAGGLSIAVHRIPPSHGSEITSNGCHAGLGQGDPSPLEGAMATARGNRLVTPRHYSPATTLSRAKTDQPRQGEGPTAPTNRRLPVSISSPATRLFRETFGMRRRMRACVVHQNLGCATRTEPGRFHRDVGTDCRRHRATRKLGAAEPILVQFSPDVETLDRMLARMAQLRDVAH